MMKYGVDDVRAFAGNDLRFLRQFVADRQSQSSLKPSLPGPMTRPDREHCQGASDESSDALAARSSSRPGLTPKELAHRLTMAGLEAEKIEMIGAEWEKVYVGRVEQVEQHPDADRLVLADVVAGEHRLTVVTGAPNIAQGQKVALALAGARLIDGHSDGQGLQDAQAGHDPRRPLRGDGLLREGAGHLRRARRHPGPAGRRAARRAARRTISATPSSSSRSRRTSSTPSRSSASPARRRR